MGYRFRGFFAPGGQDVLEAALTRWPFCRGKLITDPFAGIGVRCPDPEREAEGDEEYERLREWICSVENELPAFTRQFPDYSFVFAEADCFGGTCSYRGFAVRDANITISELGNEVGTKPLERLMSALGVRLRGGHFAPFVRGFWGE